MEKKTLFHYKVDIYSRPHSIWENAFISEVVEVAAENEEYIIVNDRSFTRLFKGKRDWDTCLNDHSVSIRATDRCWEGGVFYSQYSESKVSAKIIKNRIEKAILDKYGFLNNIDLSIVKEKSAIHGEERANGSPETGHATN